MAVGAVGGIAVRFLWERVASRRPSTDLEESRAPSATPRVESTPAPAAATLQANAAPASETRVTVRPSTPALKLPQRIVLHIYRQGRLARDDVAPAGLSQEGMGKVLGEPQSHLAKPLARLVAGGVLVVDRRHVTGKSRRLLVYTLTPLGEALARDLRRSTEPSTVPSVPAWMGRP